MFIDIVGETSVYTEGATAAPPQYKSPAGDGVLSNAHNF